MSGRRRRAQAVVLAALSLCLWLGIAAANPLTDALATDDQAALVTAVTAIESAPPSPALADALFAAARACEDRLHDPARALALYDRILRELPDARVALAAGRRARQLRGGVGEHGEHAERAKQLAELIDAAETMPREQVIAAARTLADAKWPGAPEAALFRADFMRRTGELDAAQAVYADVARRWPSTEHATVAIRGGAMTAIERHEWDLATQLARSLPTIEAADAVLQEDLLEAVGEEKFRARIYFAAWVGLAMSIAFLALSLGEAVARARSGPPLRPPVEVWFLGPFGGLLVAIAYGKNMPIAGMVGVLTAGTIAMVWLSGAALDLCRREERGIRVRSLLHAGACAVGAVALCYIAVVRAGLLDVIAETVRYGPGA